MKTLYLIIALLFVSVLDIHAQNDALSFRKIDLNANFTTITVNNKLKSFQGLVTFYPVNYRFMQFGISSGFEKSEFSKTDTFLLNESRVPLLATIRLNLSKSQVYYIKAQLGTAFAISSSIERDSKSTQNFRSDMNAPLLASIGFGVNVPLGNIGVGFEVSYTHKQFNYSLINEYPSTFSFGFVVSVP
jgi:hypothetical protein